MIVNESQFKFSSLDHDKQDLLYDAFKRSYERATGSAWDRGTFERKAYGWVFFGNEKGGIAVRPQHSGLIKMNAVYGNPRNINEGLNELLTTMGDKGIWTVATKEIVDFLNNRMGFKSPSPIVLKILVPLFSKAMGAEIKGITKDGGMKIDTVSGEMIKYFTGNKQYYKWLMGSDNLALVGDKIKGKMGAIVKKALQALTK